MDIANFMTRNASVFIHQTFRDFKEKHRSKGKKSQNNNNH
jgi:hypothetical protein